MNDEEFTHEDILKELAALQRGGRSGEFRPDPLTFTRPEWQKIRSVGRPRALEEIRKMVNAGVAEPAMVERLNIQNVLTTVFGYRIIDRELIDKLIQNN